MISTRDRMHAASDFDPCAYGDGVAAFYDQLYASVEPSLLDCLASLARGGPVLDLGVGNGRVAIPLQRRGVDMHGIDASSAMLAALGSAPGGAAVRVRRGDFARDALGDAPYSLIFSLVSTLSLLPSIELQSACLANIARHLRPDGLFVCESYPDAGAFPAPRVTAVPVSTPAGPAIYRATLLVPPLTLFDQLAEHAGLRLRERWNDWMRTPHRSSHARAISVYEKCDRSGSRHSPG